MMKKIIFFTMVAAVVGCGGVRAAADFATKHKPCGQLDWLVTLSILGIGASVAAAIFLPIKAIASACIGGFVTILALALFVSALTPYLPWIALGLTLMAIAAGIWYFRKYVLTAHAAVAFGKAAADVSLPMSIAQIKVQHAAQQTKLGVKSIIDDMLTKANP